jgi:hypothetical protein
MSKIKKGSVVNFKLNSEITHVCYVSKLGKTVDLVFYCKESKKLKQYRNMHLSMIKETTFARMPKALKEHYEKMFKTLKKGTVVEFSMDNKTFIGIVEKGGTDPTVVYDNGKYSVKGKAHGFTEIDSNNIPKDEASVMDKWKIISYTEYKKMSEETIAFDATVTLNGEKVFSVKNSGKGGCMDSHFYDYKNSKNKEYSKLFDEDLLSWAKQFGLKGKPFELDEEWILWYAREKPIGITAKEHFKQYNESMDNIPSS